MSTPTSDSGEHVPGVSTEPEPSVRVEWEFCDGRRVHTGCGGLVSLMRGRPACGACGSVDDNAGWRRKLLMWNWHQVSIDRWPGWDRTESQQPAGVRLSIINKRDKSSDDIANEYDSTDGGLFYCRDVSLDGSCYVGPGERYEALFWFERIADRDTFHAKYGGTKI